MFSILKVGGFKLYFDISVLVQKYLLCLFVNFTFLRLIKFYLPHHVSHKKKYQKDNEYHSWNILTDQMSFPDVIYRT